MRDLDVLLEHLRGEAESLDGEDREAAAGLLRELGRERRNARRRLLRALGSARYESLLDRVEAAGDPPLADGQGLELVDIWRSEHAKLRKAVAALGDDPEDVELHAARIKVKRARYAAELAGLDDYVKAAKRAQDVLGEHQDAAVAEARLRAYANTAPDAALAVGRLVQRQHARRVEARQEWPDAWKRLAKQAKKLS